MLRRHTSPQRKCRPGDFSRLGWECHVREGDFRTPLMFGVTIESVRHWKFRPYTSLAAKKRFCGQLALQLEANEHGVNYKIVLAPPAYPPTTNFQNPYPNELKRFKFYATYLNPLRPYISDRDSVIRVLGDSAV